MTYHHRFRASQRNTDGLAPARGVWLGVLLGAALWALFWFIVGVVL